MDYTQLQAAGWELDAGEYTFTLNAYKETGETVSDTATLTATGVITDSEGATVTSLALGEIYTLSFALKAKAGSGTVNLTVDYSTAEHKESVNYATAVRGAVPADEAAGSASSTTGTIADNKVTFTGLKVEQGQFISVFLYRKTDADALGLLGRFDTATYVFTGEAVTKTEKLEKLNAPVFTVTAKCEEPTNDTLLAAGSAASDTISVTTLTLTNAKLKNALAAGSTIGYYYAAGDTKPEEANVTLYAAASAGDKTFTIVIKGEAIGGAAKLEFADNVLTTEDGTNAATVALSHSAGIATVYYGQNYDNDTAAVIENTLGTVAKAFYTNSVYQKDQSDNDTVKSFNVLRIKDGALTYDTSAGPKVNNADTYRYYTTEACTTMITAPGGVRNLYLLPELTMDLREGDSYIVEFDASIHQGTTIYLSSDSIPSTMNNNAPTNYIASFGEAYSDSKNYGVINGIKYYGPAQDAVQHHKIQITYSSAANASIVTYTTTYATSEGSADCVVETKAVGSGKLNHIQVLQAASTYSSIDNVLVYKVGKAGVSTGNLTFLTGEDVLKAGITVNGNTLSVTEADGYTYEWFVNGKAVNTSAANVTLSSENATTLDLTSGYTYPVVLAAKQTATGAIYTAQTTITYTAE